MCVSFPDYDSEDYGERLRGKQAGLKMSQCCWFPNGCAIQPAQAETAQSITTRTINNYKQQTHQQNKQQIRDVVVYREEPQVGVFSDLLHTMATFGISPSKAQRLIQEHGPERVRALVNHTRTSHAHNPAGYLIRALEQGWKLEKQKNMTNIMTLLGDGRRYTQGQYAEFIRS
jgi:hypothetical protein